jgi:hypothetical protein
MPRLTVFILLALGLSIQAERAEDVDPSCHARNHWDLDGPALTWGLTHLTKTAQACCDECKTVPTCNSWTWCPELKCWSPGACGVQRTCAYQPVTDKLCLQDVWDHGLHSNVGSKYTTTRTIQK